MSDDNKTNEELLKEVKRLRQLEEDKANEKLVKKTTEKRIAWGCSGIIFVIFIILFIVIASFG